MSKMNRVYAVILCTVFVMPLPKLLAESVMLPTGSVTLSGLSPTEMAVVKDPNFRKFIEALAPIEDNYRRGGTLDTKKLLMGSLRGAIQYGTGDRYSAFITADELAECAWLIKGENKAPSAKVIDEEAVAWRKINRNLAYVKIPIFRAVTVGQFDRAVEWLVALRPRGLIIDLRDDPGGFIDTFYDIMEYLVSPNKQVVARVRDYKEPEYFMFPHRYDSARIENKFQPVKGFEFLRTLPIVVLINGNTVSAAEMMAAALRDAGRAKLVGEKSRGKGVFQSRLVSELGESFVTSGVWLTPLGASIQGKGLIPDFTVADTRKKKNANPKDAQLKKAIRVLRDGLKKEAK